MAKKPRLMTSEEWTRWQANSERLRELCERGLKELGMTREELFAKLGLPDSRTA
jgi:hypothetical protein